MGQLTLVPPSSRAGGGTIKGTLILEKTASVNGVLTASSGILIDGIDLPSGHVYRLELSTSAFTIQNPSSETEGRCTIRLFTRPARAYFLSVDGPATGVTSVAAQQNSVLAAPGLLSCSTDEDDGSPIATVQYVLNVAKTTVTGLTMTLRVYQLL